jgi:hypothetical protein
MTVFGLLSSSSDFVSRHLNVSHNARLHWCFHNGPIAKPAYLSYPGEREAHQ